MIEGIKFRMLNLGKLPMCNCKRERAPIIFGYSFVLCWRCTSILAPIVIMKILFNTNTDLINYILHYSNIFIILGFTLTVPTFIDGMLQYGFGRESTNFRRIITGFPAGCGLVILKIILNYNINVIY